MTEADALEVVTMLAARFPGQVPKETGAVWASDLKDEVGLEKADGMEAAKVIGKTSHRLYFSDFVAAAHAARDARSAQARIRYETSRNNVLQLPARTTANPVYPRAAIRVVKWAAQQKSEGRACSEAECALEMERILREETAEAKQDLEEKNR